MDMLLRFSQPTPMTLVGSTTSGVGRLPHLRRRPRMLTEKAERGEDRRSS